MSRKIDPKEVLCVLNALGYKNIDAKLLKLFIKDMKRVRKFEDRKRECNPAVSSLKKEAKQTRRSVKIILTKPSGSIISLTDDSNAEQLENSNDISKIEDQSIDIVEPSDKFNNSSIVIFH